MIKRFRESINFFETNCFKVNFPKCNCYKFGEQIDYPSEVLVLKNDSVILPMSIHKNFKLQGILHSDFFFFNIKNVKNINKEEEKEKKKCLNYIFIIKKDEKEQRIIDDFEFK